mmetsp:Transcript_49423/g.107913  ORF Transcript_49423/g.107913 Transcript_49423/m.107913 type:complete len:236 (-) Transcript_49423:267-974(-)
MRLGGTHGLAVAVMASAACHRSSLLTSAACGRARPPRASLILGITLRSLSGANSFLASRWRSQSSRASAAIRCLFADHLTLWLGAILGLLALPLADWLRANRLAEAVQSIVAHELALRLFASRMAGRGGAIQSLLALARVLGAIHLALGLGTLNLALLKSFLGGLGAPGLTLGSMTERLAILLANGLAALPRAMRNAALSLVLRNNHLARLLCSETCAGPYNDSLLRQHAICGQR